MGRRPTHSYSIRVVAEFGHGDEHDFDDLVTSQHEINRLRTKVQRLQAECHRWQQVHATQVGGGARLRGVRVGGGVRVRGMIEWRGAGMGANEGRGASEGGVRVREGCE